MPVTRYRDLFARQPPAILEPTFADHSLETSHPQVGTESKIVLPRADEYDIPLLIDQGKLLPAL